MNKSPQLKPLSNPELSSFSSQLSLILRSGISALEGISIMLEDASSEEEKAILNALSENLQETGTLNGALEQTQLFPAYMTRMVRIGEETGTLDDVMAALGDHYAREDTIARTIRSAVTYPMIIISMMIVVILVLIIKVMPIFNQVFIQLGSEMSGFSRVLMDLGNTINRYSVVFIAVLAVIAIGFFAYNHTAKGAAFLRGLGSHIPAIRRMHHDIASCRFASGMALTLKSGMAPEECLSQLIVISLWLESITFIYGNLFARHIKRQCFNIDCWLREHLSRIRINKYARFSCIGCDSIATDEVCFSNNSNLLFPCRISFIVFITNVCFCSGPLNRCCAIHILGYLYSTNDYLIFITCFFDICLRTIFIWSSLYIANQRLTSCFCQFKSGIDNIHDFLCIDGIICTNLSGQFLEFLLKVFGIIYCISILTIAAFRNTCCNVIFQEIGSGC